MAEGRKRRDMIRQTPLAGHLRVGRHGAPAPGGVGITIRERFDLSLVLIAPYTGGGAAAEAAVKAVMGIPLPSPGSSLLTQTRTLIWLGPEQWLAVCEEDPDCNLALDLATACGPDAAVMDQSHGRACIRMTGTQVRDALARLVPLDLHPEVFQVGDVKTTAISHMTVTLHHTGPDMWDLYILRGFARHLLEAVEHAASPLGYQIAG